MSKAAEFDDLDALDGFASEEPGAAPSPALRAVPSDAPASVKAVEPLPTPKPIARPVVQEADATPTPKSAVWSRPLVWAAVVAVIAVAGAVVLVPRWMQPAPAAV